MNPVNPETLINIVKPYTLLSEARLRNLMRIAKHLNESHIPGDFVECGTMNGGSAAVLSRYLAQDRHLWLYDSFEGMPTTIERDGNDATAWIGKCVGTLENVTKVMQLVETGPERYTIRKGWFEKTLLDSLPHKVALLHCDADWYESVNLVLEVFYERISKGGCIVLDDCGYWEGCREAFYDFCAKHNVKPLIERIEDSQAYWIKGIMNNRIQCFAFNPLEEKLRDSVKQTKLQLEQTKAQFESSEKKWQSKLDEAEVIIKAMESSKFWRLRTYWFKFKRILEIISLRQKTISKNNNNDRSSALVSNQQMVLNPILSVKSPLTGTSQVTLLRTIQTSDLIRDWQENFQIDITNELHDFQDIYLYQCDQTKLKFFVPFEVTGSSKLYEKLSKFDWYYMPDKWEYQAALKDLAGCLKIIEVGSGSGSFVQLGLSNNLDIRGIELNDEAIKQAQQNKLPVERLDLEEAAHLYPKLFDTVCSFQVLEHVPNPKDFIHWSLELLKPGGKLILCVPNSESFLKYQYNLLDLPPHHMIQWSRTSFKALEELFPLKLEKVKYEPLASYHVLGYLHAYKEHFNSRSGLGHQLVNQRTLPFLEKCLNLGLRHLLTGQSLYVQFRKTQ